MISDLIKRILTNFKLDFYLLSSPNLGLCTKFDFLWKKYLAILLNKRKIDYLGRDFYYDNRFTPALLEGYPKEISDLDKAINLSKIDSVMDIGANIGQFACTMKILYPRMKIHSFEPNREVYPILRKNSSAFKNFNIHNFGLGTKAGIKTFYFSPAASAEGSLYRENMDQNYVRKDIRKTSVKIVKLTQALMKRLRIPKKVDLVKIDVEGAEMDVLRSLKPIDFDYLYIEVSVKRKGEGDIGAIKQFLRKEKKVEPKLIYYNLPGKDSPCANAIFSLKK